MADIKYLSYSDGILTLGGVELPGVFVSANIGAEVTWSEAKEDAHSGTKKTALGWTDSDISFEIVLHTDEQSDCYDKLKELDKTFKGGGKGGRPQVYEIRNRHTLARGIKKVVFDRLDSSETDQDDTIRCSLRFTEHLPAIIKRETPAELANGTPEGVSPEPELDDSFTVDLVN